MEDESHSSSIKTGTRIVEAKLPDGTTFYTQVKTLDGESDVGLKIASFEGVTQAIEGIAQTLTNVWKKVEPSKASVELSVELALKSGNLIAVFVDSSATASLRITLEWSKP